jgi:hypothetical protein
MSHIVMQGLKIFKQKSYALFFYIICTVQKSIPLLHKVVLHYKITAASNTWHSLAVSGVIKHLEAIKMYFSHKIHVFIMAFSYSTLLIRGIEKWKYGNWKFLLLYMNAKPIAAGAGRHLDTVCIQFSVWCHSEFEYHSFISHDIRAWIRDYWMTAEQFLTSFYSNTSYGKFTLFLTLNDAYENYSFGSFGCWWNSFKIQWEACDVRLWILPSASRSTIQRRDSVT